MRPEDAIRRALLGEREPVGEEIDELAPIFGRTRAEQVKEMSRRSGVSKSTVRRWLRKLVKPKPKTRAKLRRSAAQLKARQRREQLRSDLRGKGASVHMRGRFRVGGSEDRSDMSRATEVHLSEESMGGFLDRWEAGDPSALRYLGDRFHQDTEFGAPVELLDLDAFELEPLQ